MTVLGSGCVTSTQHEEFVKSVDFSPLQTFSYKHTLVTGMDWAKSTELMLEQLSEETASEEVASKGFAAKKSEGDFFIVLKWRKALSVAPSMFNSIDGRSAILNDRDRVGGDYASRVSLSIEVYEASSGDMFWNSNNTDLFEAIQLTEARVKQSIKRGLKNFPERIERDPTLPNIE